MAIPYVVRKKADLTSGERKELWYGVPSKIQDRGGVQNKELAQVVELRGGFHRGSSGCHPLFAFYGTVCDD